MKKPILITIAIALFATGCGLLTPAVESGLNTAGIAILCSLEGEELNDPVLNADCQKLAGTLTAPQREVVARHTAARADRAARKPVATDGGAP